jgi:hypothetical protein
MIVLVVALFQGREVSFWPPKVSLRPEVLRVQVGTVNIPDDTRKNKFFDGGYRGNRTILVSVPFELLFKKHVRIIVGQQKIDLESKTNSRLLVRAENPRLNGFDLCFETWEDSKVYDAAAFWIALGD